MTKYKLTVNLSKEETKALNDLCKKKGVPKTRLVREALKLYQQKVE